MKLGFHTPIVRGILDSLNCNSDSNAQESGFPYMGLSLSTQAMGSAQSTALTLGFLGAQGATRFFRHIE